MHNAVRLWNNSELLQTCCASGTGAVVHIRHHTVSLTFTMNTHTVHQNSCQRTTLSTYTIETRRLYGRIASSSSWFMAPSEQRGGWEPEQSPISCTRAGRRNSTPYMIRMADDTSWDTLSPSHFLMNACTSCACSGVATCGVQGAEHSLLLSGHPSWLQAPLEL